MIVSHPITHPPELKEKLDNIDSMINARIEELKNSGVISSKPTNKEVYKAMSTDQYLLIFRKNKARLLGNLNPQYSIKRK